MKSIWMGWDGMYGETDTECEKRPSHSAEENP